MEVINKNIIFSIYFRRYSLKIIIKCKCTLKLKLKGYAIVSNLNIYICTL